MVPLAAIGCQLQYCDSLILYLFVDETVVLAGCTPGPCLTPGSYVLQVRSVVVVVSFQQSQSVGSKLFTLLLVECQCLNKLVPLLDRFAWRCQMWIASQMHSRHPSPNQVAGVTDHSAAG